MRLFQKYLISTMFIALATLAAFSAWAGDTHEFAQIDTCYHWLRDNALDAKIEYAKQNKGELAFYDAPIYCWRSPLGAYSSWEDHGNWLIRIKFKPGTRIDHLPRQGLSEMQAGKHKVIYSNDNDWQEYTVAPEAVESWSVFEPQTAAEMQAELKFYKARLVTANDVFYPFGAYDLDYMNTEIPPLIRNHQAMAAQGKAKIYGAHQDQHFKTAYPLPWQKFLKRDANNEIIPAEPIGVIKVISASYGKNLDVKNVNNAKEKAAAFCDGKDSCSYKVSPQYIGDPAPGKDKSFSIAWTCGKNPKVFSHDVKAPADDEVFDLACP